MPPYSHSEQSSRGFVRVARRRPVGTFMALALPAIVAVATVAALMEYRMIPGRATLLAMHTNLEQATSLLMVICLISAAVAVTASVDGRAGVRSLLQRSTIWRVSPIWWLVAIAALPITTVAIALLLGDTAQMPSGPTLLAELGSSLVAFLLINIGEETAWMGFMQRRMSQRHSMFTAAAITAVPFSFVHMPLRVVTREVTTISELVFSFVALTLFILVFRTLVGAVFVGSGSVLLAAITHTSFNRSNNADGLAADVLSGVARSNAALLATVIVTLAVSLSLSLRRRLQRRRLLRPGAMNRPSEAFSLAGQRDPS